MKLFQTSLRRAALLAAISLPALAARADKTVPGGTLGSDTWLEDEVITVTGDIDISGTVSVAPGVTVRLGSEAGIRVLAGASLLVGGTAEKPVTFTSSQGSPACGDWDRISFLGQSTGVLDYAIVQYASNGIDVANPASMSITHSTIEDICGAAGTNGVSGQAGADGSAVTGIGVAGNGSIVISDNVIRRLRGGDGGRGGNGLAGTNGMNGSAGTTGAPGADGARGLNCSTPVCSASDGTDGMLGGSGGNGTPGAAGAMGSNGFHGGLGAGAQGIVIDGAPQTVCTRNAVYDLSSGNGGDGGNGGPGGNGGSGGSGGQGGAGGRGGDGGSSVGVPPGPAGSGGDGGNGGMGGGGGKGGPGGNGGSGGPAGGSAPCVGLRTSGSATGLLVSNILIYNIGGGSTSGTPGAGGIAGVGGAGGNGGSGGVGGNRGSHGSGFPQGSNGNAGASGISGSPGANGASGQSGLAGGSGAVAGPKGLDLGASGVSTIEHVTYANGAVGGYGASVSLGAPVIRNSTFSGSGGVGVAVAGGSLALDHNNVFGFTTAYQGTAAGASDLAVDPGFADAPALDFHLVAGSALINAGATSSATDDLDGNPRDGSPDIGAYEGADAAAARAKGDFDASGCSDISDFLYMLDNWHKPESEGGADLGLNDFLALIDNWMSGLACS